jgi:nitrogen-specific signal transduction histidine kinase
VGLHNLCAASIGILDSIRRRAQLSLCGAASTVRIRRQSLSPNAETQTHAPGATGDDVLENLLSAFKQSLTSIRAAADILRDNPDLPADLRDRLHAVVIADGERLNRLVDACFQEGSVDLRAGRLSLPIPAGSRGDG